MLDEEEVRTVSPGDAGTYPGPTIPVTVVGRIAYFSGVVGLDASRQLVGPWDVEAQADQALTTIAGALTALGGSLADVVHLRVYVTRRADIAAVGLVLDRRFGQPWPSTTMVAVAALAMPQLLVEIEPIAILRRTAGPET